MIAKIEKGERSPTLIVCLRVADALWLNLGDVLEDSSREKRRAAEVAGDQLAGRCCYAGRRSVHAAAGPERKALKGVIMRKSSDKGGRGNTRTIPDRPRNYET